MVGDFCLGGDTERVALRLTEGEKVNFVCTGPEGGCLIEVLIPSLRVAALYVLPGLFFLPTGLFEMTALVLVWGTGLVRSLKERWGVLSGDLERGRMVGR